MRSSSEIKEESNLAKKGLLYLTQYPYQEFYRLVVDGDFHEFERGWVEYEKREEGCLEAVFTGLGMALSNLEDTSISEDLIKRIHAACYNNVKNLDKSLAGTFRKEGPGVGYPINTNTTLEGLTEILDYIETQNEFPNNEGLELRPDTKDIDILKSRTVSKDSIQQIKQELAITTNAELARLIYYGFGNSLKFIYASPKASTAFHDKIKNLIANYNQHIQNVSGDKKLELIIETVAEFDRLHPFYDANIRTFSVVLLNRLLIQNGFPPATQADPSRVDGYSKDQLLLEIKKSIENTEKLLSGVRELFYFDSSTLSSSEEDQHLQYSQSLIKSINKEADKFNLPHLKAPELSTFSRIKPSIESLGQINLDDYLYLDDDEMHSDEDKKPIKNSNSSTASIYKNILSSEEISQVNANQTSSRNINDIAPTTLSEIDKPKMLDVMPLSSMEAKKISFALNNWELEISANTNANDISKSIRKILENNVENLGPDNKPDLFNRLDNVIKKTSASPLYENINKEDFDKLKTLIENKKPNQNDNTYSSSRVGFK